MKMKKSETDLLYAFCDVSHERNFYQNRLVKILEYTHSQSALPRAKVLYQCERFSLEFFTARINLTRPIKVKSFVRFYISSFNITAKATFYKHPDREFTDEKTPYVIEEITANGFNLQDEEKLAEFISVDIDELRPILHKNLLNYADDLPF
jgi:hypothetical protein